MLAKTLPTLLLLLFTIPNIGMSGVMMRSFDSKVTVSASTGDEEAPIDRHDYLKNAPSMKGVLSSSVTISSTNSNGLVSQFLFTGVIPSLESIHELLEWRFVPEPPMWKIPKVPISKR